MRFKHNKKRNTAFLYEALVRELTSSIISKQVDTRADIISIVKEHFGPGTALSAELEIYKALTGMKIRSKTIAEKVLQESKSQYELLDRKKIFEAQSRLISEVNRKLGKNVYSNFVPNYKSLANIYQFLNVSMSPRAKVLLETSIIGQMCADENMIMENSQVPSDRLVLKTFISKFNETYSNSLHEEQKELLNKYVGSFADNGLDLKVYLNEEIPRLRSILEEGLNDPKLNLTEGAQNKAEKVLNLIGSYHSKEINTSVVEQVLKIQNLAREIIQ